MPDSPLPDLAAEQLVRELVEARGLEALAARLPPDLVAGELTAASLVASLHGSPTARAQLEGLYLLQRREQAGRAPRRHGDDLRGAAEGLVHATRSVTRVVEEMHGAIFAFPVITGLVYAAVDKAAAVVGTGVDAALAALSPLLGQSTPGPEREALVAVLNGVVGSHLEATHNPLAIPMTLRPPLTNLHDGGTLLLLVHGSCMNDLQWTRGGHDHGRVLGQSLGFTPVYAHYNSGRHTSDNGRDLAALLEDESAPFRDIIVLGHSMGGLVARSAVKAAEEGGLAWRHKLRALVTLGTPHHGAPLERAGNLFESLLGVTRWTAPLATLGRLRSDGVTDLRHGNVVPADWQGQDRFMMGRDGRVPTPLPEGVRCLAVAATRSPEGTAKAARASDSLVPVDSALGVHPSAAFDLGFDEVHVVHETHHVGLLDSLEVCGHLERWLGAMAPR